MEQSKWAFWRGGESKVREIPKRLNGITKVILMVGICHESIVLEQPQSVALLFPKTFRE